MAQQMQEREHYIKLCMCALQAIHKRFSLLIEQNDVWIMTLCKFPPFVATKRHFRWSDKGVVGMSSMEVLGC